MAQHKVVFLLVPASGEGKDRKTYFNRAGVAFENKDGSLNVKLDMFPGLTFNIRESLPANGNGNSERAETVAAPDKPF